MGAHWANHSAPGHAVNEGDEGKSELALESHHRNRPYVPVQLRLEITVTGAERWMSGASVPDQGHEGVGSADHPTLDSGSSECP